MQPLFKIASPQKGLVQEYFLRHAFQLDRIFQFRQKNHTGAALIKQERECIHLDKDGFQVKLHHHNLLVVTTNNSYNCFADFETPHINKVQYFIKNKHPTTFEFAPIERQLQVRNSQGRSQATNEIPKYLEVACGFKDSSVMVFDPHMRSNHIIRTFNMLRAPAKKEKGVKLLHWIPELTTRFLVQFEDNTFYEYDVMKDDKSVDEDEAGQVVTEMRAIERVNFKTAFRESISGPEPRKKLISSFGSQKRVTYIEGFSSSPPILNLGFMIALNQIEHGPLKIWRFNERCLIYDFKLAYINSSRLFFAMACGDNLTKIYDYFNFNFLCGFESYYGHPLVVQFSSDSTLLAVGYQDDSAGIYDLRNFTLLFRLEGHHSFVTHLKFDHTFSQLESVLQQKKTESSNSVIPSLEESKVEQVLQLTRRSSTIKKTSTKFYRLISGSEDGFLNFWDIHVPRNVALTAPSQDIANYDTRAPVLNPVHRFPLDRVPIVHVEVLDSIIAVLNETYVLRILQPQYDVLKEQSESIDDDPLALSSKKPSAVALEQIDFQLLEKQD